MATNQYRGKEESDKIDFAKLTPEEQRKVSRENRRPETERENTNEDIAEKAKKSTTGRTNKKYPVNGFYAQCCCF